MRIMGTVAPQCAELPRPPRRRASELGVGDPAKNRVSLLLYDEHHVRDTGNPPQCGKASTYGKFTGSDDHDGLSLSGTE